MLLLKSWEGVAKKKKGKRKKLHQESHNNEKCDSLKLAQKLHHRESGMETMELCLMSLLAVDLAEELCWAKGRGGALRQSFQSFFL